MMQERPIQSPNVAPETVHHHADDPIPEVEGRVADALRGHWADHLTPKWFRPYARLSRLERPIGWWLLLWPCWWSLALAVSTTAPNEVPLTHHILWFGFLLWLGSVAMRGAGCTYNDLVDHGIDEKVERTRSRPLPSNQTTRLKAWVWLASQLLVGLFVLLQFNSYTIILGFASLLVVAIYPFMKRITHWPQLILGFAFSWGALVGWSAITANLSAGPILAYLAAVVWTVGYDTIYAHQDKDDDILIGVKSTALLFAHNTKRWLALFYTLMITLMACAYSVTGVSWPAYIGLALAALHMGWQIRTLDIDDGEQCLTLFKSNSHVGALIFAGILASIFV